MKLPNMNKDDLINHVLDDYACQIAKAMVVSGGAMIKDGVVYSMFDIMIDPSEVTRNRFDKPSEPIENNHVGRGLPKET